MTDQGGCETNSVYIALKNDTVGKFPRPLLTGGRQGTTLVPTIIIWYLNIQQGDQSHVLCCQSLEEGIEYVKMILWMSLNDCVYEKVLKEGPSYDYLLYRVYKAIEAIEWLYFGMTVDTKNRMRFMSFLDIKSWSSSSSINNIMYYS